MSNPTDLSTLPIQDLESGETTAIVETPRGSRNKYAYDPEIGALRLKAVLPAGSAFPFDFGFIPSTKAPDGDPLDVLILLDEAAPPGCVIPVRVIGAIEAEQRENDGQWLRNDRLVAVASHARQHSDVKSIKDINQSILDEVEAFFAHYDKLAGKEFKVIGRCGPKQAAKLIEASAT